MEALSKAIVGATSRLIPTNVQPRAEGRFLNLILAHTSPEKVAHLPWGHGICLREPSREVASCLPPRHIPQCPQESTCLNSLTQSSDSCRDIRGSPGRSLPHHPVQLPVAVPGSVAGSRWHTLLGRLEKFLQAQRPSPGRANSEGVWRLCSFARRGGGSRASAWNCGHHPGTLVKGSWGNEREERRGE